MPYYFKLSPELGDGQISSIALHAETVLESIREWISEFCDEPGASFSVEVVEMTEEEVSALPEI